MKLLPPLCVQPLGRLVCLSQEAAKEIPMSSRAGVVTATAFSPRACSRFVALRTASQLAGYTVALMLCSLTWAQTISAQDNTGITVAGTAKVAGKPTSVEIPCIVSGDAELTADAIVKYRDARKRAV